MDILFAHEEEEQWNNMLEESYMFIKQMGEIKTFRLQMKARGFMQWPVYIFQLLK